LIWQKWGTGSRSAWFAQRGALQPGLEKGELVKGDSK
jgi:hypothetical protein